ncbi:MAG TPA: hypothetical protein VJV03_00025 [Pyrinomonadaceae bacterium]|nr:hypothetical protein [Pyrinomonadaceae bacterium]
MGPKNGVTSGTYSFVLFNNAGPRVISLVDATIGGIVAEPLEKSRFSAGNFILITGFAVRQKLNNGNRDRRQKEDVDKSALPQREFQYSPDY